MKWMTLEIGGKGVQSDKSAKRYKKFLRENGIEVRKLPFGIGENLVEVRKGDFTRVVKLFKGKKLKELGV